MPKNQGDSDSFNNEQLQIAKHLGAISVQLNTLISLVQASHEETREVSSKQVHTRLTRLEEKSDRLRELIIKSIERTVAAINQIADIADRQEARQKAQEDGRRELLSRAARFLEKPWLWIPLVTGGGFCAGQVSNEGKTAEPISILETELGESESDPL